MNKCRSGNALRRQEGVCTSLQQPRASMSIQMVSPLSCRRQRQGSALQATEHPHLAMARLVRPRQHSMLLPSEKRHLKWL